MDIIRKYWWWIIIAIIAIPIILNTILLIPAFTPIVGDNTVWLSFLGSLIGALASFAMIFFTAKSLEQNRLQLDELKRQWAEAHKPYITCHLVTYHNIFRLCVTNSSNVVAQDVQISIKNYLDKAPLHFEALQQFLENKSFIIPPRENIYFNILITAFKEEENLPKGFLSVSAKCGDFDYGIFSLYPSHHAYIIYENDGGTESEISNRLEDLNSTIRNMRFM